MRKCTWKHSQNVKNTRSSKVTANVLQNLLNESLETGRFPDNLKLASGSTYSASLKKNDPLDKTNDSPVSVPRIVSKLCENKMKSNKCVTRNCLPPYLYGNRKELSNCLISNCLISIV